MTPAEIAAALQVAFQTCDAADVPLTQTQKQMVLEAVNRWLSDRAAVSSDLTVNPLDELTETERRSLLRFIQDTDRPDYSWKVQLLNDWLQGKDSGAVQFIRERYGLRWLDRVQPVHVNYYLEREGNAVVRLALGDRIEVCNALWEWVQESGPCDRQWFPCTVVKAPENDSATACCIVRFDTGAEYEIQGVYDWNRYNWRKVS